MDDVVCLEFAGVHAEGGVFGFDRPDGHLDDHTVAQGRKFLIDPGGHLGKLG